jgi:hypothetical protein
LVLIGRHNPLPTHLTKRLARPANDISEQTTIASVFTFALTNDLRKLASGHGPTGPRQLSL